jgi:hypothetical protein
MSIRDLWEKRVQDHELFKLDFLIPGPPEARVVLMSPEMRDLVIGPWPETEMGDRCARLRGDLENILAGARVVICWTPHKGREHHQIGRLAPVEDNLFDIRSVCPSPGLRVLFHFAEKDVLVTHLCSPRSIPVPWLQRLPLLGARSKAWRNAIRDAKSQWSILFPNFEPHSGNHIDDYISNAVLE